MGSWCGGGGGNYRRDDPEDDEYDRLETICRGILNLPEDFSESIDNPWDEENKRLEGKKENKNRETQKIASNILIRKNDNRTYEKKRNHRNRNYIVVGTATVLANSLIGYAINKDDHPIQTGVSALGIYLILLGGIRMLLRKYKR